MARLCPDCIYYAVADTTCRRSAPPPALSGSPAVVWPRVAATDWCAEGYNPADGAYDQAPANPQPAQATTTIRRPA